MCLIRSTASLVFFLQVKIRYLLDPFRASLLSTNTSLNVVSWNCCFSVFWAMCWQTFLDLWLMMIGSFFINYSSLVCRLAGGSQRPCRFLSWHHPHRDEVLSTASSFFPLCLNNLLPRLLQLLMVIAILVLIIPLAFRLVVITVKVLLAALTTRLDTAWLNDPGWDNRLFRLVMFAQLLWRCHNRWWRF